jgi:adenylosuccinate lyase
MLNIFIGVIGDLVVYPERMLKNMDLSHGLVFSQRVLLALADKGLSREKTYEIVQRCAMRSQKEGIHFKDALLEDKETRRYLNEEDLEDCFDLKFMLRNIDEIYKRLDIG